MADTLTTTIRVPGPVSVTLPTGQQLSWTLGTWLREIMMVRTSSSLKAVFPIARVLDAVSVADLVEGSGVEVRVTDLKALLLELYRDDARFPWVIEIARHGLVYLDALEKALSDCEREE